MLRYERSEGVRAAPVVRVGQFWTLGIWVFLILISISISDISDMEFFKLKKSKQSQCKVRDMV